MTRDYETDQVVRDFVDKYDFYFAPVINPDGYQYSWDVVRAKTTLYIHVGLHLHLDMRVHLGSSATNPLLTAGPLLEEVQKRQRRKPLYRCRLEQEL